MMPKKIYAVKKGVTPGIYQTWKETQKQVEGFSGAIYKSFTNEYDAEQFMKENSDYKTNEIVADTKENVILNEDIEKQIAELNINEAIAFVDGSYNAVTEKAGFGTIIINQGGEKSTFYKSFDKNYNEDLISLRNVAAELEGVKEAVRVAVNSNKIKLTIYYDYEGIEKWVNRAWKANKQLTKNYVEFIDDAKKKIEIVFIKVPAHSGIVYNEEADRLAKSSLEAKGHKTYEDGSVYFIGYTVDDWASIVDFINEENKKTLDSDFESIHFEKHTQTDNKCQLVIRDSKNRVSVNIYNNNKSYVQGKQSVLFQKCIVTAIQFLTDDEKVVDTLNKYHALTITKEEVEIYFDKFLPNYYGNRNDKMYSNLLSALYNMLLTGYMPDYTCLVTPIFRAYEFCLHKILGGTLGLSTSNKNGKNNFGYFEKKNNGDYECTSLATSKMTKSQQDFLNRLYSDYHKVRHVYSHWSADDIDTAMITTIEKAREILEKGLLLVDEYYKIF